MKDLLKEAIADAKAVKETAIANAKAALEEAFNPMIHEKLAAKLAEMDDMEEAEIEEGIHLSPEAGKKLSAAVAKGSKGGKVNFQSTSIGKDGTNNTSSTS